VSLAPDTGLRLAADWNHQVIREVHPCEVKRVNEITALVESPVNWIDTLDDPQKELVLLLADHLSSRSRAEDLASFMVHRPLLDYLPPPAMLPGYSSPVPPGYSKRNPFYDRFLDELHDLLCSEERYSDERKRLLDEYNAGRTSFVAGVTATLAPYLGTVSPLLSAAVAVVLTVIGQTGLRAWCAMQHDRRNKRRSGSSDEHGQRS
jgi:hypothetical protein